LGTNPGRILTFEPSPKPLRLGLYEMTVGAALVGQSPPQALDAADRWTTIPVSEGMPTSLRLRPGTYALVWQSDADESVPSFAPGVAGEGIQLPGAFGPFPPQLSVNDPATSWTTTASRWSAYLDYDVVTGARGWQVWR
jgi:hypothetical protein